MLYPSPISLFYREYEKGRKEGKKNEREIDRQY